MTGSNQNGEGDDSPQVYRLVKKPNGKRRNASNVRSSMRSRVSDGKKDGENRDGKGSREHSNESGRSKLA